MIEPRSPAMRETQATPEQLAETSVMQDPRSPPTQSREPSIMLESEHVPEQTTDTAAMSDWETTSTQLVETPCLTEAENLPTQSKSKPRGGPKRNQHWVPTHVETIEHVAALNGGIPQSSPALHTSDYPNKDVWSAENLPEVLFYIEPPAHPMANIKPQTFIRADGVELRRFDILPDFISCAVEGWLVVAWRCTDSRIKVQDILARMTEDFNYFGRQITKPNLNTMSNECFRSCRKLLGLWSDVTKPDQPHRSTVECVENLSYEQLWMNTVLSRHPKFHQRLVRVQFVRKGVNHSGQYMAVPVDVTEENLQQTTYDFGYFTSPERFDPISQNKIESDLSPAISTLWDLQNKAILHELGSWHHLEKSCLPESWFDRTKEGPPEKHTYDGGCDVCTWIPGQNALLARPRPLNFEYLRERHADKTAAIDVVKLFTETDAELVPVGASAKRLRPVEDEQYPPPAKRMRVSSIYAEAHIQDSKDEGSFVILETDQTNGFVDVEEDEDHNGESEAGEEGGSELTPGTITDSEADTMVDPLSRVATPVKLKSSLQPGILPISPAGHQVELSAWNQVPLQERDIIAEVSIYNPFADGEFFTGYQSQIGLPDTSTYQQSSRGPRHNFHYSHLSSPNDHPSPMRTAGLQDMSMMLMQQNSSVLHQVLGVAPAGYEMTGGIVAQEFDGSPQLMKVTSFRDKGAGELPNLTLTDEFNGSRYYNSCAPGESPQHSPLRNYGQRSSTSINMHPMVPVRAPNSLYDNDVFTLLDDDEDYYQEYRV